MKKIEVYKDKLEVNEKLSSCFKNYLINNKISYYFTNTLDIFKKNYGKDSYS